MKSEFTHELLRLLDKTTMTSEIAEQAIDQIKRKRARDIFFGKAKATHVEAYEALKRLFHMNLVQSLKAMPYKQFLGTRYWQIVRNYVLEINNDGCELCCNLKNLHVHHKTYEHLGEEIYYINDLAVLCAECHARHHDKCNMSKHNKSVDEWRKTYNVPT